MRFDYETPNIDRLRELCERRGMTTRQLNKLLFDNEKTKRDVIYELQHRPDMRSSTLVKICAILDIPIDELFLKSDESRTIPTGIDPDGTPSSQSLTRPSAQSPALLSTIIENQKALLSEKDRRIGDLKETIADLNRRLDKALGYADND